MVRAKQNNSTESVVMLDRPPAGWFVLDVMRRKERSRDWTALMIDIDPDDFRSWRRSAHDCWVRIPGKYNSRDAAYDALEELMATRH